MKEVCAELKEKMEALTTQEKLLEKRTVQLLTEAAKERSELLNSQNEIIEQSWLVLEKVQTTYQTRISDYEVQPTGAVTLIKQLKKDK